MRAIRTLFVASVLSGVLIGFSSRAEAHGGRGRTYTATGPATHISAPALGYYGGFGQGAAVAQTVATPTTGYTGAAYAQGGHYSQRPQGVIWHPRGWRWVRGW